MRSSTAIFLIVLAAVLNLSGCGSAPIGNPWVSPYFPVGACFTGNEVFESGRIFRVTFCYNKQSGGNLAFRWPYRDDRYQGMTCTVPVDFVATGSKSEFRLVNKLGGGCEWGGMPLRANMFCKMIDNDNAQCTWETYKRQLTLHRIW